MANNAVLSATLTDKLLDAVSGHLKHPFGLHDNLVLRQEIDTLLNAENKLRHEKPQNRRVTIMRADLRGFEVMAETYSAAMVMDLLNRFLGIMTEVIVAHDGIIDKLMGDSILVLFGAGDRQSGDGVEQAIACAVRMQHAMSAFNSQNVAIGLPELYIGIGINTGSVVLGPVGSRHRRDYMAIGDEVNLTSRIEAHSLRGQILISENTLSLCQGYVLVNEPNRILVKGRDKSVNLYELIGTTKPRSMMVPRREGRRSHRVSVIMPCDFQLTNQPATGGRSVHRGQVLDISYRGMQLLSPLALEPGTDIKLALSLEMFANATTDIHARVVHSVPIDNGHQCSVEFTLLSPAGQLRIKQFVDGQVGRR